jgi:hypothetical protein
MPRVTCWQMDCLYNANGKCRAVEIEYDPADGCLTMEPRSGADEPEEEEDTDGWERRGMHLLEDEE